MLLNKNTRTLLYRSSWRYLLKHPLQLLFSVLGVALGVAIIVAIDLASHSARQSFYLSTQSVSGHASHRIINTDNAIAESIYAQLRSHPGLRKITPLIKQPVQLTLRENNARQNRAIINAQLIGIDPFSEAEIRTWQQGMIESLSGEHLQRLLTEANTVLVSSEFLQQHHLRIGDHIALHSGARQNPAQKTTRQSTQLSIIGSFRAPKAYQAQITNWLISDISTAQELLNYQGYISQIDLLLDKDDAQLPEQIKALLPEGTQLVKADEYSNAIARLSQSFELNLTALSMLGLLVSMFLIYNTMMFSVVQRRDLMARMRVLGVTRKELFRQVLAEALVIAILAIGCGLIMALGLAQILLYFVTRTINDLYYVLQVTQLHWTYISVLKAVLLGVGATLLSAIIPALEAAYSRPVKALQRSDLEAKIKRWSSGLILPGLAICLLVYVLVKEQTGGIATGFILVFVLIIGLICLLPFMTRYLLFLLAIIMKRLFLLPGKMAVNNISRSFSRSIVAIAALSVSVSAALGIGIMVDSFRFTVDEWLLGYLKADYYISPADTDTPLGMGASEQPFAQQFLADLSRLPGVEHTSSVQEVDFYLHGQYHHLTVLDIPPASFTAFRLKEGNPSAAQTAWLNQDAVIISEPYAYRHGLSVGDEIELPVSRKKKQNALRSFRIVGIYYHYGSEHGVINMSRTTYNRYWQDRKLQALGVYLSDEILHNRSRQELFEQQLQKLISGRSLQFVSRQTVHKKSLMIFDRTFNITNVLKLLVILVSFVGILSALMAIELERSREFAILRATGLTGKQLSTLVYIETLSMGIVAALLAMPMGIAIAYLLVEVVNYRSFGWSMQFILPLREFVMAAGLAILSALLAGIYPAWHLSRTLPALALRGE
ncbi:MAG: FtsX-like permease family protein [Gammaproteobacteria bacterium]|nr:FtsX-like permease family protein [Gammaproteobacteria bacterium]